jgi:hypothetical protein
MLQLHMKGSSHNNKPVHHHHVVFLTWLQPPS